MNDILVSISTVTYNHEKYISECIESVINQCVNFKFEMVIGEDCSTDKTRNIIKKYERDYPEIIKPIYNKENLGKKSGSNTGRENYINVIKNCKGKYIVHLDGDDFFLPGKLQKQVDYMNSNPECSMSGHNVKVIYEDGRPSHLYTKTLPKVKSLGGLIRHGTCILHTSMIFKRRYLDIDLFQRMHHSSHGDWLIHMIVSRNGKIGYLDKVLSTYRKHRFGVCHTQGIENVFRIQMSILDNALILGGTDNDVNQGRSKSLYECSEALLREKRYSDFKNYINKAKLFHPPVTTRQFVLVKMKNIPRTLFFLIKVMELLVYKKRRIVNVWNSKIL